MKKEFLINFYNKEIFPKIDNLLFSLDIFFKQEKDTFKDLFLISFQKMCMEILEYQTIEEKEIGYIGYTMLRTNLLEKNFTYAVYVFDESWYLQKPIYSTYFDVSLYFQQFNNLWNELLNVRKRYLGISENYIENCISQFFSSIHQYIVKMIKYALLDALKLKEYKAVKKSGTFFIYAGELCENHSILHREANKENELFLFEDYLEDKKPCKFFYLKKSDFSYRSFKGLDLSGTNFEFSNMKEADLSDTILIQTSFLQCDLSGAKFINANLNESNFEKAVLCHADFTSAFACSILDKKEKWINPSAFPVNFDYADLKNAVFNNAVLIGIDFTKVDLQNVTFKDAVIKQCYFTSRQLQYLNFIQAKQFDFIEI